MVRKIPNIANILATLTQRVTQGAWRVLGVTLLDLYIPILTFVFGEAQMNGNCAMVSAHRLHQEFYGLPADPKLFRERLLKESTHKLGTPWLCRMVGIMNV
jgi:archaemetzincin